jgi:hypothetical protein
MTDLLGRIMWETSIEFNNGEVTLDVTGMANGPYFIYLFSNKDVIRHTKLIKF